MKILIINSGSSSLKAKLLKTGKKDETLMSAHIDGIGLKSCKFTFKSLKKNIGQRYPIKSHKEGLKLIIKTLQKTETIKKLSEIKAVGHRVVHGGEKYTKATKVTKPVLA